MKIDNIIINETLESILARLVAVLRGNRIDYIKKMKPTSTHVQICCPYHNNGLENNPSMGVRKSDGMCHCFTCHIVVSLPEMISYCFGKDDKGAFGKNWILQNFVSMSVESRKPLELNLTRGVVQKKEQKYVSEEELSDYRVYHEYWEKRKIVSKDIIALFDLGYDRQTEEITMPVRDIKGNTLFIARRSVRYKRFFYPKGSEKPVYGLWELSQCRDYPKEVIIVESIIDALTCWEYGKYAVALNGLGTALQFQQLSSAPCRKYIIATDMDEAGLQARKKIASGIKNKIITEYIWDISIAKDINDMTREYFNSLEEVFLNKI